MRRQIHLFDSIVYCNSDFHKQKSYTFDFYNNNFKNNLNTAIANIGIEGDYINSDYVYSNIDNKRQNSTL